MCLHIHHTKENAVGESLRRLYDVESQHAFMKSEPDLLSTPRSRHVSGIRNPVDRLCHMNDDASLAPFNKPLGRAELTASPNLSLNSSSFNLLERSFSASFFSASQMLQGFGLAPNTNNSDPFIDLRQSIPSSQPALSTICSTSASNEDMSFWAASHYSGTSKKLSSSQWHACDIMSLSDTDDVNLVPSRDKKNSVVPDYPSLTALQTFYTTSSSSSSSSSKKHIPPTSLSSLSPCDFPSSCHNTGTTSTMTYGKEVRGTYSETEPLPTDSPLLNALLYQEVKRDNPTSHDPYEFSERLRQESNTLLSSLFPDSSGDKKNISCPNHVFENPEQLCIMNSWGWENYGLSETFIPRNLKTNNGRQFPKNQVGLEKASLPKKQCASPLSLSGASSTATSSTSQPLIRSSFTKKLSRLHKPQHDSHERLYNTKDEHTRGTLKINELDDTPCYAKVIPSAANRFGVPLILAHPEEFKNPSSFLKVYGDPLCNHLLDDKKNSVSVVRGENGNWGCQRCGNVNYPRRFRCNKCNALRNAKGDAIVSEYVLDVYEQHLKLYRRLTQSSQVKNCKSELSFSLANKMPNMESFEKRRLEKQETCPAINRPPIRSTQ